MLSLSGGLGETAADSVVVTIRPDDLNDAPTGTLVSQFAAPGSYSLRAEVRDPEQDSFSCTWTGDVSPVDGLLTTLTLPTGATGTTGHASAVCCDDAAACANFEINVP